MRMRKRMVALAVGLLAALGLSVVVGGVNAAAGPAMTHNGPAMTHN